MSTSSSITKLPRSNSILVRFGFILFYSVWPGLIFFLHIRIFFRRGRDGWLIRCIHVIVNVVAFDRFYENTPLSLTNEYFFPVGSFWVSLLRRKKWGPIWDPWSMYFFSSSSSSSPSTLKIGDLRTFRWQLKLSGRVLLFSSRLGKCISSFRSISIVTKWDSHSMFFLFVWQRVDFERIEAAFLGVQRSLAWFRWWLRL